MPHSKASQRFSGRFPLRLDGGVRRTIAAIQPLKTDGRLGQGEKIRALYGRGEPCPIMASG